MFGGEAERDDVAEAERVFRPDGLVHFPADALHVRCESEHDNVGKCALDDLGDGGGECVLRAGFGDAHIVRADGDGSDVLEVIRGLLRHGERDAPVDRADVSVVQTARGGDVLAARECGRGTRARTFEKGVLIHRRGECPAVDGCDLLRDAERFVAVVRDEDGGDVLRGKYLAQGGLDLPFEMRVERGERLVEEQDLRAAREDARECDTLLLSAGQPCGIGVFKALQGEPCDVFGL